MKCVKKGDVIRRVKDEAAQKLVSIDGWVYCPKHEWKAYNKEEEE